MSDLFQLAKKYREVDPNNDTFKIPGTGVDWSANVVQARKNMLRGTSGGYDPDHPVTPSQPAVTVNMPIMQQPVVANSVDDLVSMIPSWANVYVFASVEFTDNCPIIGEEVSVIYSRENQNFTAIASDMTVKCTKVGNNWSVWTGGIVSIPETSNVSLDGLARACTHFPMHAEVLRAQFAVPGEDDTFPYDGPNSDLGNTWKLDIQAFAANDITVTASGYGKEYFCTYKGVSTGWSAWQSTHLETLYFCEADTQNNFSENAYRSWVAANIEDPVHNLYTVEFFDVKCSAAVSPTGSADTHYHVLSEKTSDGSIIMKATVVSGGTSTYPNGTVFRNVYKVMQPGVSSGWVKVSVANGVINITGDMNCSRAQLYALVLAEADRDTFTAFCDSVRLTDSAYASTTDSRYAVRITKTTDRAFMQLSMRTNTDYNWTNYDNTQAQNHYWNLQLYTSRLDDGTWTDITPICNPYLGIRTPITAWYERNRNYAINTVGNPNVTNWGDSFYDSNSDFSLVSAGAVHQYIDRVATVDDTDNWAIPTCAAIGTYVADEIDDALGDIETILTTLTTGSGV